MGEVCTFASEDAGSPYPSTFPTDDITDQHLAKWNRDISRAASRTVESYQLRSAETADLAQEARIRVLRVLHRNPSAHARLLRRVISRAVRKEANRDRAHQVERLDVLTTDNNEAPVLPVDIEDGRQSPELWPDPLLKKTVNRWLGTLPVALQQVFKFLYVEDRNQRQAALEMGISQPRVAQLHNELLSRGRIELATLAA